MDLVSVVTIAWFFLSIAIGIYPALVIYIGHYNSLRESDEHSNHGISDNGQPLDSDCPCRGSSKERKCSNEGCGFCIGQ